VGADFVNEDFNQLLVELQKNNLKAEKFFEMIWNYDFGNLDEKDNIIYILLFY
jgi:hypothetical protein